MLLKSLQYFWFRAWDLPDPNEITLVTGETYWLYRLYAESAVFAVLYLGLFGIVAVSRPPEMPVSNGSGLACVFAFVGLLEWARLRIELREQREFAELFYG
jgi:hypothetical protein